MYFQDFYIPQFMITSTFHCLFLNISWLHFCILIEVSSRRKIYGMSLIFFFFPAALKSLGVFFISVTSLDEMCHLLEPCVALWDTSGGGEQRK